MNSTEELLKLVAGAVTLTADEVIKYIIAVKIAAALTPLFLMSVPFLIDWLFHSVLSHQIADKKLAEESLERFSKSGVLETEWPIVRYREKIATVEREITFLTSAKNILKRVTFLGIGMWTLYRVIDVIPVVVSPYVATAVELKTFLQDTKGGVK